MAILNEKRCIIASTRWSASFLIFVVFAAGIPMAVMAMGGLQQPATLPAATQPARTLTCSMTGKQAGHPDQNWKGMIKGGRVRMESSNGIVAIYDAGQNKMLLLDPHAKTATISTPGPETAKEPMFSVDNFEKVTEPGAAPFVPLVKKQIDGRDAEGICFDIDGEQRTVWRDTATHRPVLIDVAAADHSQIPLHIVYSDIVFDMPLDDALFSMQPPTGYEVKQSADIKQPAPAPATTATQPAITPAPTAPSSQPAAAGKLDFRIAAEIGEVDKPTGNLLPTKIAEKLVKHLKEEGPVGKYDRPNGFDWFEAVDAAMGSVKGDYQNRHYVLLMTTEAYTMLAVENGRRMWGLTGVYPRKDVWDRMGIGIDFDDAGSDRFSKLTGKNIQKRLAILIDGRVVAAPQIEEKISGSAFIQSGDDFDADTTNRLIAALRRGMLVGASVPAAAEPADGR